MRAQKFYYPQTFNHTGWDMAEDKRKHERYSALNLSYICEDKDGDVLYEGMGRTLNVSEGGILLETNFYISPGNTLTLEIALEDNLVNLRGRVIYCNEEEGKKFHTGLELLESDQAGQAILHQFIKIFAKQQG
jgi:hypothetical protein